MVNIQKYLKQTIAPVGVLGLLCATGCKTTYIMPDTMASVNVEKQMGENLVAERVVTTKKSTTIDLAMSPVQQPAYRYRFSADSYLLDEGGRKYPLLSAQGITLDSAYRAQGEEEVRFSLTFDPLPKEVKMFDFIEGNAPKAFRLLGIRDKKTPLTAPTYQELSSANKYTLPDDWLVSDSVTVRGRIEGYDAKKFGFKTLSCRVGDVFGKYNPNVTVNIARDGSFEQKFYVSYPMRLFLSPYKSKVTFPGVPFFARPGETVDITIRQNEHGVYEGYYNGGTSQLVERWLKSNLSLWNIAEPLMLFDGKLTEMGPLADSVWNNLMARIQIVAQREQFSPLEVQLALAEAQVEYANAVMNQESYARSKRIVRARQDGSYYDGKEEMTLYEVKDYTPLHRVDFDNQLMLSIPNYYILVNHIGMSDAVYRHVGDSILTGVSSTGKVFKRTPLGREMQMVRNRYALLRKMMNSKFDNLMAQICVYDDLPFRLEHEWLTGEEKLRPILADSTLTEREKYDRTSDEVSITNIKPHLMPTFVHPFVHDKAQNLIDRALEKSEYSTALPDDDAGYSIREYNMKFPDKYLLFDFWDMGCVPCRYAIENGMGQRASLAAREDVMVIFIASEVEKGGSKAYRDYVEKWKLDGEEFVCVSPEEFARLQNLFQFNGIPHQELITPDGRRVSHHLYIPDFFYFEDSFDKVKETLGKSKISF